jgi:glycine reductase complex component B subunit gamma
MTKVMHYLNQFFAGIGGEEKAGQEATFIPRPVGAGSVLCDALRHHDIEYATIVCGDNFFHEEEVKALSAIQDILARFQPDIFLAGPAFNAGRYGLACAKVCSWVRDNRRIPTVTAMHDHNPGTKEIGRYVFVIQTGASAAAMQECLKRYAQLIEKLLLGDQAAVENFRAEYCLAIPRRFTARTDRPDYVRAADMLLTKLRGKPYESEIPRVEAEQHAIPNLAVSLEKATVALVTEGGLVPNGNPDRLESTRGSKYLKYSIRGREDLKQGEFQAMHTGYDTSTVDQDPDRIVPLDAMRVLEKSQRFKKLHDYYFVTTGTGAMPSKMEELGNGMADELAASGVDAVILTAT